MDAPELIRRQRLGFFPTPITQAKTLGAHLHGPELYIKRDDLTGLALGGNKVRKLEFLAADAISRNADCLITAGAAQSNHCRQTAAAAASLGLECHLLLGGEKPDSINGNLLLDYLFGAQVHWCAEHRKGEDIPRINDRLIREGKTPYVVPYGGSNATGALGFVHAIEELVEQVGDHMYSHIFFASSSGATHAGMIVGKSVYEQQFEIVGIDIDKSETPESSLGEKIVAIANATAEYFPSNRSYGASDIMLDDNYVGEGYGVVGDAEREAIRLLATKEGILLDPVYTGRAMAGLIDWIRMKKLSSEDRVLFWHTGGVPALFDYASEVQ